MRTQCLHNRRVLLSEGNDGGAVAKNRCRRIFRELGECLRPYRERKGVLPALGKNGWQIHSMGEALNLVNI